MLKVMNRGRSALLTVAALGMLALTSQAQETAVKNGEKIAFLGDSITQQGAGSPRPRNGTAWPPPEGK